MRAQLAQGGEEDRAHATAPSVRRAWQRELDDDGGRGSDAIRYERHLRKLDRAVWHRRHAHERVRNEYGQWVYPNVLRNEDGQGLIRTVSRVNGQRVETTEVAGHRVPTRIGVRCVTWTVRDETRCDARGTFGVLVKRREYRLGWYNGTSGGIRGVDGVQAARDVARLLVKPSPDTWTPPGRDGYSLAS